MIWSFFRWLEQHELVALAVGALLIFAMGATFAWLQDYGARQGRRVNIMPAVTIIAILLAIGAALVSPIGPIAWLITNLLYWWTFIAVVLGWKALRNRFGTFHDVDAAWTPPREQPPPPGHRQRPSREKAQRRSRKVDRWDGSRETRRPM